MLVEEYLERNYRKEMQRRNTPVNYGLGPCVFFCVVNVLKECVVCFRNLFSAYKRRGMDYKAKLKMFESQPMSKTSDQHFEDPNVMTMTQLLNVQQIPSTMESNQLHHSQQIPSTSQSNQLVFDDNHIFDDPKVMKQLLDAEEANSR